MSSERGTVRLTWVCSLLAVHCSLPAVAAPPSADPAPAPVGHGPAEQPGSYGASFETVKTWPAAEAGQAAAVDAEHFYAIVNTKIGKYDKGTGGKVGEWAASEEYPVTHMNAGVVGFGGTDWLAVANSTFPRTPSGSSLEWFSVADDYEFRDGGVYDPANLGHSHSFSFGPIDGSLTWVDDGPGPLTFSGPYPAKYFCFVHYSENVDWTGRDTSWTRLERHYRMPADKGPVHKESWLFPRTLIEKFEPHSCSGGSFGPDGRLYVTGHDLGEVYVVELPKAGPILRHVATLPAPGITGQGIAWDRTATAEDGSPLLYGINRPDREVVVMKLVGGERIGDPEFDTE